MANPDQILAFFFIFRAMRVLLAFLLLNCLCLASRAKTNAGTPKSPIYMQQMGPSLKAAIPHQKAKSALHKETFANEEINLIHQPLASFALLALPFVRNYCQPFFQQTTVRIFRDKSNYSYHFIWSCLYPKHTFW